ncbi:MAG: ABC transporter ATP-binding protein [bacterium]|nr:ABC transporter ATP-binding protein [bacterium]
MVFEKVSKTFVDLKFRKVQALQDINLYVKSGEFIAVLGPSGCGKSTLLRLAAGLDEPTAGRVVYQNEVITGPSPDRGLVFQAYNAFPWLTVRENVAFGISQDAEESHSDEISKWLSVTGLSEFADCYPKVLSGGMRQRVALARTMIVKPGLLLLDEPFGALDELTRDSMQRLLLQLARDSDCTVLLVTHDIREAVLLSDRVILLSPRPGQIVEVFNSPLPKPRTRHLMKSPEFDRLHECIVERLGDQAGNAFSTEARTA